MTTPIINSDSLTNINQILSAKNGIKGLLLVSLSIGFLSAAPTQIQDLSVSPGDEAGDVVLSFTAPNDSAQAVDSYLIFYKYGGAFSDQNESGVNFYQNSSDFTPDNPGGSEELNLSGFGPGETIHFGIISRKDAAFSPLSNIAGGNSQQACDRMPEDGEGSVAIGPATFGAGEIQQLTMTYTVGPSGIQPGGAFGFQVPDDWEPPSQTAQSNEAGYVNYSYGGSGTVTPSIDGRFVIVAVDSNGSPLQPGDQVILYFNAQSCVREANIPIRFYSQAASCGQPVEIANSPTVSVLAGPPKSIAFEIEQLPAQLNTTYGIDLVVNDCSDQEVPVSSDKDVTVAAILLQGSNNFDPDPDATLSLASDLSNPFTNASGTVTIPSGQSRDTIYYQLSSSTNSPDNKIGLQYTDFFNVNESRFDLLDVIPISGSISNVSVDTGTRLSGQTSVSFSPDGDGISDRAFINFSMPAEIDFVVKLSKDNFSTVARTFYGRGTNMRMEWMGDEEDNGFFLPAAPGTYEVKIEDFSGYLTNQTLTITLSANGVSGRVVDGANPIENAYIECIQGESRRFGRSQNDGTFTLYGLRAGAAHLRINQYGYAVKDLDITIPAGVLAQGDIDLDSQSQLKIHVTRPTNTFLPEVFGHVCAHTNNWSSHGCATVRFQEGTTESDAGDDWNTVSSSYTTIFLDQGTYEIEYSIPNLGISDSSATLSEGDVEYINASGVWKPSISGQITLPAGSNPNGTWISIEAGPDTNNDQIFDDQNSSRQTRFYGGMYISQGFTQGTYILPGVDDGELLIIARAQRFLSSNTNVTVSGADVPNIDFSLSQGGNLSGIITINGDTTSLDEGNGTFSLNINCWSPLTYQGSWESIDVPINSTQTTASYTLYGLDNDTYDIYVQLPGFGLNPPQRLTGTVAAGVGTRNITLDQFTGQLTGTITLPNDEAQNVDQVVQIRLQDSQNSSGSNEPSPTVVYDNANRTYTIDNLGTGFFTLKAYYSTTGLIVEKNVSLVNGDTTTENIDLTGATYDISGVVTSDADYPYNSLSYLINDTTDLQMQNTETNNTITIPAHHIVAIRTNDQDYFNQGGQGGGNYPPYDPKKYFYGTYNANGTYSINNLSPGTYRIYANGELDNNGGNGKEISEPSEIIYVDEDLTKNFTLKSGYDISGQLRVSSGRSESDMEFDLYLQNDRYQNIAFSRVTLNGNTVPFTLRHIPSGFYRLGMRQTTQSAVPPKYVAKDLSIEVTASNISGKELLLVEGGRIQGQLRVKTSGELVSYQNFDQILSNNFRIEARANPWFQGGYGFSEHPLIDASNVFNILVYPGTYDLTLKSDGGIDLNALSQGQKQFSTVKVSGIEVGTAETKNVGIIDLAEGKSIHGIVTDSSNNPLANILVNAIVNGQSAYQEPISGITNNVGEYTLYGLNADETYDVIAAPRPDINDPRFVNFEGLRYGEVRKNRITVDPTVSIDFELQPAPGSVVGRVLTPDNGPLLAPFGNELKPGASIILNPKGQTPENNPLGDIEVLSDRDGNFEVEGLVAGVYSLWTIAQGYANVYLQNVVVGSTTTNVGNLTLGQGLTLSGEITKPDGSAPNELEVAGIVAVRDSFRDLIVGRITTDASGSVTGYSMTGLQSGRAYQILAFNEDDAGLMVLENSLTITQNEERNFILEDTQTPQILAQATKNNNGDIEIKFEFTKALRNSSIDLDDDGEADDSDIDELITIVNGEGSGTLTFPANALSSDRTRLRVTYTPAVNETSFSLRANVTFNSLDAEGEYQSSTEDFEFFIGIEETVTNQISNINGGEVELADNSAFSTVPGTFGDDGGDSIEVTFRAAEDTDDLAGAGSLGSSVMKKAEELGLTAYPSEMSSAISKLKTLSVTPLSSFYDIFLPAGVSHFFPEGKEATICLAYEDGVSDPSTLNIYYYNSATNEYLLEANNKTVDTVNQRVCASIAHASVFTILNSSTPILQGGGYTGELSVINFPNPFNLKEKTVTLQNPGSLNTSQTITGTLIKFSLPNNLSGDTKIEIYNVAGEKVRTLDGSSAVGGAHYYQHWDGKNERGEEVASGTYIGRFTIGGTNEKMFKMAVLK
jgi:hypothetical protein